MLGKVIKTGAKNFAKKKKPSLSKKEQVKSGMGLPSKKRIDSATRSYRTTGQNKQLQESKKDLKIMKEKYKINPTPDLAEKIKLKINKINDIKKRTGLRKRGGSVGSHNRLY
tara:strand:- start:598 stop:933 length:336 start_codon:yes stop_codon:yes gene_type:complete